MNKLCALFIIITLSVIFSCKKTYKNFDFRQVAWGMSPEDVMKAETRDFHNLTLDDVNKIFHIEDFGSVVGWPYKNNDDLIYRFTNDGKLGCVDIYLYSGELNDIKQSERMEDLKTVLSNKYGASNDEKNEGTVKHTWETPQTIITLTISESNMGAPQNSMQYDYTIRYASKELIDRLETDIKMRKDEKMKKLEQNY